MTKLEAVFVIQRIKLEGSFKYALTMYSSYPAIKDEEFHKLRKLYRDEAPGSYKPLNKYILEAAGLKGIPKSWAKMDHLWKQFTKNEIDKEAARWELELWKDLSNIFSSDNKYKEEIERCQKIYDSY